MVSSKNTIPIIRLFLITHTISQPLVQLRRWLFPLTSLPYFFLIHMQGVTYFVCPFAAIALQRWPTRRLLITVIGLAFILIGLVSASFARHANDLVITQGAIYGFGGALLYQPFVFYLDEWFIARKGLAFGILWAGTGVGGAVIPLIMNWCLDTYGFRTTLRMWAVTIVSLDRSGQGFVILT